MAMPLLLSKPRVNRNGRAVVQLAAVAVALLVATAVLALGTPPMRQAASETQAATSPAAPPPGVAYERATAELTRVNHLLEARQTELALSAGSSERSLAVLRAQVASLERQYVAALEAVTHAR